jgi:hypothetical protein
MYEKTERKSTTYPDGTFDEHLTTQRSTSGLTELFMIPIGLTLTAVVCWLIIQVGAKIGSSINPPTENAPRQGSAYVLRGS